MSWPSCLECQSKNKCRRQPPIRSLCKVGIEGPLFTSGFPRVAREMTLQKERKWALKPNPSCSWYGNPFAELSTMVVSRRTFHYRRCAPQVSSRRNDPRT